jgi:H+/Cl- antiporter ClcA
MRLADNIGEMFKIKLLIISAGVGVVAGSASAFFIESLELVSEIFASNQNLIFALPFVGLAIGWFYSRFGHGVQGGLSLLLDEIHTPTRAIPLRLAPMILGGTLLTHLAGGSAGREGAAVQMGGALADSLGRFFRIHMMERKSLLVAGMAAGFGTAVGAPWAGVIFGLEVLTIGKLHLVPVFECLIAVFTGSIVFTLWGAHHTIYQIPQVPDMGSLNLLGIGTLVVSLVAAAVAFGFCARAFVGFTHGLEKKLQGWITHSTSRGFVGGVVLLILFKLEGSFRFCGLGIDVIQESLSRSVSFLDPLLKFFLTAITLAFGFKGGEFIPLVFVGSTLGSALGPILHLDPGFLAALGLAATFGAAANVPIACTVMAVEIFGLPIAPYAGLVGFVSYLCSGSSSIYKGQRASGANGPGKAQVLV